MCRSIKVLRQPEQPATPEEIRAAALQFVRKITGFRKPSRLHEEAFERAVEEVAASSQRVLAAIRSSSRERQPSAQSAEIFQEHG